MFAYDIQRREAGRIALGDAHRSVAELDYPVQTLACNVRA
jgi:hypothetical protein